MRSAASLCVYSDARARVCVFVLRIPDDDTTIRLDLSTDDLFRHGCKISLCAHTIKDKTDAHKLLRSFYPSTPYPTHTYTHTHILAAQYFVVARSTAGNIWRRFESVYISKMLKNCAGARRVIKKRVPNPPQHKKERWVKLETALGSQTLRWFFIGRAFLVFRCWS